MQTVKTIFLILISIALLGACGNKGPLYLPEEKPAVEQAPPSETNADKKEEKKKESAKR